MNFLIIPVAVFMVIVALLILKEIAPDTTAKKIFKAGIILLFVIVFLLIAYYMS